MKVSNNKLTISIVNFNAGDYLIKCLDSIEQLEDEADIKIYVVDNNSSDESIKSAKVRYKKINFILNKDNLGFGKAHNQVLKKIRDGYILILNPDTIINKGVLSKMIKFMEENPNVGASTCRLVLPNGEVDLTAHRGLPTPWASFKYYILGDDSDYHLTKKDLNSIHEVDAISGSFFLTKVEVLAKVGYFDEDYFMYAEDIDLSLRIKKAGYKIMYVPEVSIIHYKGISTGLKKHSQKVSKATFETRLRSVNAFYSTMKIFYKKHLEKKYPLFINWLVYLGIDIKWWLAKRELTV